MGHGVGFREGISCKPCAYGVSKKSIPYVLLNDLTLNSSNSVQLFTAALQSEHGIVLCTRKQLGEVEWNPTNELELFCNNITSHPTWGLCCLTQAICARQRSWGGELWNFKKVTEGTYINYVQCFSWNEAVWKKHASNFDMPLHAWWHIK